MLRPLAFDQDLAKKVGSGPPARGLLILRNALLQTCVQDFVKLTLDADPRTPSVTNLMAMLEDSTVRGILIKEYAVAPMPVHVGPGDPLPEEFLVQMQAREQQHLATQFAEIWSDLAVRWAELAGDKRLSGLAPFLWTPS